ncbi:hypothetical protein DH2020_008677 [Rehmannia glutinosa]|uniref:NADH dehydrogenase [ubiquinone] 1 alpha subcomplex subunit 12 n=1 Tax=Rehmannia glutinosa TaxID=99300 RepID=A0ABR0X7E0_REHGL
MSRLWARFAGLFSSRAFMGMDKTGNRYFARTEQVDGAISYDTFLLVYSSVKEKRWVVFKGEQDPTSIPAQKGSDTRVLKKEEEERKAKGGKVTTTSIGKAAGPDLTSFIQQFPTDSEGNKIEEASDSKDVPSDKGSKESQERKEVPDYIRKQAESTEPSGSGESFRPGTWQPPT